jgi:hypothetical protein
VSPEVVVSNALLQSAAIANHLSQSADESREIDEDDGADEEDDEDDHDEDDDEEDDDEEDNEADEAREMEFDEEAFENEKGEYDDKEGYQTIPQLMSLGRELEGGQVCHGCFLKGVCLDAKLGRKSCEKHDGLWHTENPRTKLVKGEIAEMGQLSALDTNGDGDISEAELSAMLKAMGERPAPGATAKLKASIKDFQKKSGSSELVEAKKKKVFFVAAALVAVKAYKAYKVVKVAKAAYKAYKYYNKAKKAYNYVTPRRRRSTRRRRGWR